MLAKIAMELTFQKEQFSLGGVNSEAISYRLTGIEDQIRQLTTVSFNMRADLDKSTQEMREQMKVILAAMKNYGCLETRL